MLKNLENTNKSVNTHTHTHTHTQYIYNSRHINIYIVGILTKVVELFYRFYRTTSTAFCSGVVFLFLKNRITNKKNNTQIF